MVLDVDVGPILQARKLLSSMLFARAQRLQQSADGGRTADDEPDRRRQGIDIVTMPQAMREQVPTANFFQRGGYERNPVAIRNNTVAKLRRYRRADGREQRQAGREGTGGGILAKCHERSCSGCKLCKKAAGRWLWVPILLIEDQAAMATCYLSISLGPNPLRPVAYSSRRFQFFSSSIS